MPLLGSITSTATNDPVISTDLLNDCFVSNSMSITHYPATICKCWDEFLGKSAASGSPDPSCPDCLGRGWRYVTATPYTGVLVTNMHRGTEWDEAGQMIKGGALLTIPNLSCCERIYHTLKIQDIVVCTDFSFEDNAQVKRGEDTLAYPPISVYSLNWSGVEYTEGTDFRIEGRSIVWITAGPPAGETYAVVNSFHPQYMVIRALATLRNYASQAFPRSWAMEESPHIGEFLNPKDLI